MDFFDISTSNYSLINNLISFLNVAIFLLSGLCCCLASSWIRNFLRRKTAVQFIHFLYSSFDSLAVSGHNLPNITACYRKREITWTISKNMREPQRECLRCCLAPSYSFWSQSWSCNASSSFSICFPYWHEFNWNCTRFQFYDWLPFLTMPTTPSVKRELFMSRWQRCHLQDISTGHSHASTWLAASSYAGHNVVKVVCHCLCKAQRPKCTL